MRTRIIKQATTSDCLFNVIAGWCNTGSGKKNQSIYMLSAFASGGGVEALSPFLDVYLSHGNTVEIIVGIDRNGTEAEAIRRLFALQEAHHEALRAYVFNAPSKAAIFHPKLYINERGRVIDFVIGSANMTGGGMGTNFESLILYENVPKLRAEAIHAMDIWNQYSAIKPPLKDSYLKQLTKTTVAGYCKRLPEKPIEGKKPTRTEITDLWKPFSHISLPNSTPPRFRKPIKKDELRGDYLLMDVLTETRKTQMQLPVKVQTGFFGLKRGERKAIEVSILSREGLSQPICRPLVKSGEMRRIEIPGIRTMERLLAILFVRLDRAKRFAYRIFPRETAEYKEADLLLAKHGQQGKGKRRYVIADKNHPARSQITGVVRALSTILAKQ